jgi:ABC-type uncharacterized transport system permease subunit
VSEAAALPKGRRRRWRPPNLREQRAIRRCSWALVALTLGIFAEHLPISDFPRWVACVMAYTFFWKLLGFWRQPWIVLRYLRTCWTDD